MHLKSCILGIAALSLTALPNYLHAADFKASDYETPAYVDLELSEVRVNEPAGTVAINIIRTGDFRQTTTIEYQTIEDEASEGQDYKGAGGTLVFRPGEGFKTVVLEILKDDQEEAPETFRFEISSSDPKAMLMRTSTAITIEDAPAPISQPKLQIASAGNGKILLSWEGSQTCTLERTTTPGSGNWERVECSPEISGNRSQVLQPVGGKLFFYRLCSQ
jgi:hypothetical protein